MFSTCSELTPRAPIPDGRMERIMQPWSREMLGITLDTETTFCLRLEKTKKTNKYNQFQLKMTLMMMSMNKTGVYHS